MKLRIVFPTPTLSCDSTGQLENYFPEAHYQKAVDEALREQTPGKLEPDGGTTNLHTDGRRSTVYYWLDPDTGAALYHTEINEDEADPFFASVGEAESRNIPRKIRRTRH